MSVGPVPQVPEVLRPPSAPLVPPLPPQLPPLSRELGQGGVPGPQHAEMLVEMDRLQRKQASWGSVVLMLAVSLALFMGAGFRENSLQTLVLLISVLLFHELGHYLAMGIFGYRNVRMFFIPFLGAAVSGQNYNAAGWKKAIVSLMGPVPGIAVGTVIGVVGMILHNTLMLKVATMALLLNGLNLLPVLPFDGGWVMHTILFSRHYLLDVAFRLLAAGALVAAGLLVPDSKLFLYLGIFMVLGLPVGFLLARTAQELRQSGLSPVSADDQTIPPDVAEAIIGKVKAALPKSTGAKTIAQHSLQVFETLNARPPGWLPSLGFAVVHGGSIVVAVLFGFLFIFAQRGDFTGFLRAAAQAPRQTVAVESIATWQGAQAAEATAGPRNVVIGSFQKPADAWRAFEDLKATSPAKATLRLYGATVLLALPGDDDAGRKRSFEELQRRTSNVFVATPATPAMFSLTCIAPTEAAAKLIEEEVQEYLQVPHTMHLIPPWMPGDDRSAEERARHRLARQTYVKLQSVGSDILKDARYMELFKQQAQAQREGDTAKLASLRAEQQKRMEEIRQAGLDRVRNEGEGKVDMQLVTQYRSIDEQQRKDAQAMESAGAWDALGPRMGQATRAAANGDPGAISVATQLGWLSRNGLVLSLDAVRFEDVFDGSQALTEWLAAKGCIGFRYEFGGGYYLGEEEPEPD